VNLGEERFNRQPRCHGIAKQNVRAIGPSIGGCHQVLVGMGLYPFGEFFKG
jgi:hypothetical protein